MLGDKLGCGVFKAVGKTKHTKTKKEMGQKKGTKMLLIYNQNLPQPLLQHLLQLTHFSGSNWVNVETTCNKNNKKP